MCLIITRETGGQVDWDVAEQASRRNPDGYGIVYAQKGKLNISKNLDWNSIRNTAMSLEFQDIPFMLHMRLATHGAVTTDNCHPFMLESHDIAMMHNGIIDTIHVPIGESDSRAMADYLNGHMYEDFLKDEAEVTFIEGLLDGYNKLSFIDTDGNITIINDSLGEWADGVWYSKKVLANARINYRPSRRVS